MACRTERGKFSWTVDADAAGAVHGLIMGSHALPAWACMAIIPAPGALTCMHRRRRTVAGVKLGIFGTRVEASDGLWEASQAACIARFAFPAEIISPSFFFHFFPFFFPFLFLPRGQSRAEKDSLSACRQFVHISIYII